MTSTRKEEKLSIEDVALACNRANEISSLAAMTTTKSKQLTSSFSTPLLSQSKTIAMWNSDTERAIKAAEELLTLTKHPRFVSLLSLSSRKNGKESLKMHWAILSVMSWLLHLVHLSPPRDSYPNKFKISNSEREEEEMIEKLIQTAIQVSNRAEELKLPLHLPLYTELALACASHFHAPSSSITKLSTSLQRLLQPQTQEIWEQFLAPSLLQLIQRHKYHDVLETLTFFKDNHGHEVSHSQAFEYLCSIETAIDDDDDDDDPSEDKKPLDYDNQALMDLVLLLREPLKLQTIQEKKLLEQLFPYQVWYEDDTDDEDYESDLDSDDNDDDDKRL